MLVFLVIIAKLSCWNEKLNGIREGKTKLLFLQPYFA